MICLCPYLLVPSSLSLALKFKDSLQRAQARKLEFENKALILQTDHSLQKDAVAKIAQQFAGKQVPFLMLN